MQGDFSFQFTHPGRGATAEASPALASAPRFQFTHPGRGATPTESTITRTHRWFQFTHPGRGATAFSGLLPDQLMVSIHAPREGCDDLAVIPLYEDVRFQFTHPGRGATS